MNKPKIRDKMNFIHIYFGNGKGKTTAALGLAFRSLGSGKKVTIIQFDKKGDSNFSSDVNIINSLKQKGFKIDIYNTGIMRINDKGIFRFKNIKEDFEEAKRGLKIAEEMINNGEQDILILDEIISAVSTGLIKKSQVERIIELYNKNRNFELVLTGLKIWKKLRDSADLITEMRKIKHYFDCGIVARKGIEY